MSFHANLSDSILHLAILSYADLSEVSLGNTHFLDADLSKSRGLNSCFHGSESILDRKTLTKSTNLPLEFLQGCGLSDWEIESVKLFQPNLSNEDIININYKIIDIRTTQAIQINPLFISYSHRNEKAVDKIGEQLTEKGVRYWRDIHHELPGKLEKQVDRAMRLHPVVLLILSKDSINSDWVEHEAESARELEKELGRDVLCPIALDDSWKDSNWPKRLRRQIQKYKIMDFSDWKDPISFKSKFSKLLQGIDLFYK